MNIIPQREIEFFLEQIRSHPEFLDVNFIKDKYESYELSVISDPFSKKLIDEIIKAISSNSPFSVVRIGDGEANLLTYQHYSQTPNLNIYSANNIISIQQNSFTPNHEYLKNISKLISESIKKSDIVGVIGLWRVKTPTTDSICNKFLDDYRGILGHWRAIDHLLYLANKGVLANKTIASAHLYFSVLKHLPKILSVTKKLLIVSDNTSIEKIIKKKFNNIQIEFIDTSSLNIKQNKHLRFKNDIPLFFYKFLELLPPNLHGYVCLIGSGPWTEIYCLWIKQRGGIAIDIGSGFDLLNNKLSRPIHHFIDLNHFNNL